MLWPRLCAAARLVRGDEGRGGVGGAHRKSPYFTVRWGLGGLGGGQLEQRAVALHPLKGLPRLDDQRSDLLGGAVVEHPARAAPIAQRRPGYVHAGISMLGEREPKVPVLVARSGPVAPAHETAASKRPGAPLTSRYLRKDGAPIRARPPPERADGGKA